LKEPVAGPEAGKRGLAELDEPVGHVRRIEPEVFRAEFLATAPVTDGGRDKDSPAANAIEERHGCLVWIHGVLVGGVLFVLGKEIRPWRDPSEEIIGFQLFMTQSGM